MIKRTLFFSNPSHLSLKDNQMVIKINDFPEKRTIPVEDIGFVVLEDMQVSITLPLIDELCNNNVAVIFCNSRHMPSSMLLNLDGHHIQGELFRYQLAASIPLKKNLWKQTVQSKLRNQAGLLRQKGLENRDILTMSRNVKSGDSQNAEGSAARIYWKRLLGNEFIRDRLGAPPNMLLNYGYTIVRAAVARALTGSGLLPTIGIHHHNRYNAFALADDLIEPYRPFVDKHVIELFKRHPTAFELTKEHKAHLLNILTMDVVVGKMQRPLMVGLSQTTASLSRCFSGDQRSIMYPVLN